ncbi:glycosyltransferase [Pelagibacterales bacterium SAG-MED31]|nr:glycosyltransferase [Pelagibacterales bacterium SAG-MED31]
MRSSFSIIIPVYNEIKIIGKFVNKIYESFKDLKVKYIFVDDGSKDGTAKWLSDNLSKTFNKKNFELILLKKNYGKGYAVRKGIEKIEGDYTIFIDSDLEYDPSDALELFYIVNKNENKEIKALFGSRYIGGKLQLRRHFFNDIAVRINTWIFNVLFNQSISDLHSGTKIIENNLLKSLNLSLNGFGHEIDISSQISSKKVNIYETGISYVERSIEEGKKITIIDGILSYYFLIKTRFFLNDIYTQISMLYSLIFMTFIGSFFGLGIGKIMITIVFAFVGLVNAMHRKLFALSIVFFFIYLGSLFSSGNGRIYPILLFYFFSLWLTKKFFRNTNKRSNKFLNFFV